MTEQGFEQAVEQSVESFANWAWQYELIIGFAFFIVLLVIGFVLMKKKGCLYLYGNWCAYRCP